jgi:selenide,water dikinase
VGAEINAQAVPVFERALELATDGCAPGGTQDNLEAAEAAGVTFDAAVSAQLRLVLCDAQTSGGLLIALPESKAAGLLARLQAAGVRQAALIGRLTAQLGIAVR